MENHEVKKVKRYRKVSKSDVIVPKVVKNDFVNQETDYEKKDSNSSTSVLNFFYKVLEWVFLGIVFVIQFIFGIGGCVIYAVFYTVAFYIGWLVIEFLLKSIGLM